MKNNYLELLQLLFNKLIIKIIKNLINKYLKLKVLKFKMKNKKLLINYSNRD